MNTEIREGFVLNEIAQAGARVAHAYSLPTDREARKEEILHCNRSFPQLLARHGDTEQAVALSFGLAGGQETLESAMEAMRSGLGRVQWYGRDQVAVFIEETVAPRMLLERFVDAPKKVYQDRTGLKAQVAVQEDRKKRLFSEGGKALKFEDIFYGKSDAQVKGFQADGSAEFLLGYQVRGSELWGINMDDQSQSMTSLALHESVDSQMRQRLLEVQDFLTQTPKGKQRFVFTMNADKTVFCCNNATNAQLEKVAVQKEAFLGASHENAFEGPIVIPPPSVLENPKVYCATCKKENRRKPTRG